MKTLRSSRLALGFGLALAALTPGLVAQAVAVGPAIDMFHCMPAKPTPGERKFVVEPALPLVDLETVAVDATKSRDVCAPAAPTTAQIINAEINLDRFVIKGSKGQPKHVKQLGIPLVNVLGTVTLDTKARELLALPSKTSTVQLQVAPDFATHNVDRFDCYKAKISKGTPKLPKNLELTVADVRTNPPRRYLVKKVTSLCVPTAVLGTPTKDDLNLVCYQVKATKGVCAAGAPFAAGRGCKKEEDCGGTKGTTSFCTPQTKKLPQTLGLFTSDLIRGLQQDLVKDGDVCVPSSTVH